jgi:hypothetical protein
MNPYVILGCSMQSTDTQIREAYLDRVRAFPPDSASSEFHLIQEAYERIRTPEGRAREVMRVDSTGGTLLDAVTDYCRVSDFLIKPMTLRNLQRGILRSL